MQQGTVGASCVYTKGKLVVSIIAIVELSSTANNEKAVAGITRISPISSKYIATDIWPRKIPMEDCPRVQGPN